MADGWGASAAMSALDTLVTVYPWIKLHTGPPGGAGTANAATETTRKSASWSSATATASAASAVSSADLTWASVAGSEDYTDFSAWSASASGNFGFSGSITANPVTSGDTFTVSAGSLSVSVPVAS